MMSMKRFNSLHSGGGFTLVELLVVLFILSLVSLLATREVGKQKHQLRYERSSQLMDDLQTAIVGDRYAGSPRPCFLGDMGRLPVTVHTNDMLTLAELFVCPTNAPTFGLYTPTSENRSSRSAAYHAMDDHVSVPMGWRGPYLKTAPGVKAPYLRDAWGNPVVSSEDHTALEFRPNCLLGEEWPGLDQLDEWDTTGILTKMAASNGMSVRYILNWGADGRINWETNAASYDKDHELAFPDRTYTVQGHVEFPEGWTDVRVRLYGPDAAEAEKILALETPVTHLSSTAAAFAFTNVPPGHRVLFAAASNGTQTNYARPQNIALLTDYNPDPPTIIIK